MFGNPEKNITLGAWNRKKVYKKSKTSKNIFTRGRGNIVLEHFPENILAILFRS
jgi:hypothetical protein